MDYMGPRRVLTADGKVMGEAESMKYGNDIGKIGRCAKKAGLAWAFLFLCVLSLPAAARAQGTDSAGYEAGYLATLYDNSSGLPTSEANAIVQSDDGFIWIGGYSGLIRYDGKDFYRYDASLGVTSVVSLYVDSRDRLWIGTNDNGVALYEEGRFSFYRKAEGLNSLSVRSIAEDGDGNIVIATTQGLAYVDAGNVLHTLDDSRVNKEYVCEIKSDPEGILYAETLSGAFFSVENLEVKDFYGGRELNINTVSCICPDFEERGRVYLGTEESEIVRGNMADGMADYQVISVAPLVNINAISPADDGRIWICADNGIGYLDGTGAFVQLRKIPMNNSVDDMMVDYEGNLWFVSSRQGVMRIAVSRFTDISKLAGLDARVVNSTCLYQDKLYIGTDTGLCVLDANYRPQKNLLTGLLEGIRIRCIKEDSRGNLWLCSYSDYGLICYHPDGTYDTYNTESGLKSSRIRTVEELSDGTIAVATSGGVNLIRGGVITDVFDMASGISNTEILSLCEGDDGRIYLGSDGDGLYILDGDHVSRKGLDDGLKSEVVLRVKKDPVRPVYWIITSNSISYMMGEEIETISNFPYSNNFDMYFDDAGDIWVLSSNGIYEVNGDELLAGGELDYSFYDMACGLPCVATANSRSCMDAEGNLYISGASGVSSINIYDTEDSGGNVKLTVPFIGVDDELIYLRDGEKVTIPANCRRLTIYGYAPSFSLQNLELSYCLEGFDYEPAYVSAQDMQPASYTNLDGGEYVFRLSALNPLTGEVENSIAVTLIKEKAFHERGWFRVLLAAVFLFLILAAVKIYIHHKTAKLLEKQKENKIFISQIIQAFAKSIDIKDKYTNGHSFRVAEYAGRIAEELGYDSARAETVHNIGLLHDIGKITIPDEILNKPGKLTEEEYAIMKQHAANGYEILKEIENVPDLALGAGYHHERIDGMGYPAGKKEEEIPKVAQIIAVADTFDAMNSTRPYRRKMKMEDIIAELKRVSGTQLKPEIVDALIKLIREGAFDHMEDLV